MDMSDAWDGIERRRETAGLITDLTAVVHGLSTEVVGLRQELGHVDTRRRRNLLWLIPVVLLVVYAIVQQRSFERHTSNIHKQILGTAVAVCAMQNVIRIEVGNFLADAQNRGVFDEPGDSSQAVQATETRRAFLDEARTRFALVPCETLVAGENVRITLQYPPQVSVTAP